jgi:hypothetical protein
MKVMSVDQRWSRTVRQERGQERAFEPLRTHDEVAKILGISRQAVFKAEDKIMRTIAAEIVAIGDEFAESIRHDLYGEGDTQGERE